MTIYLYIEDNNLKLKSTINAPLQDHDSLASDPTLIEDIFTNKSKQIINVEMNEFNRGNLLISGIFNPCNAVIIKLNDESFCLYHAQTGYVGVVGISNSAKNLREYLESIKDQITEIYVFEKNTPTTNAIKAPELTVALSNYVKPGVNVSRFNVDGYKYVICDSKENQILLFKNIVKEQLTNELINNSTSSKNDRAIQMIESIPIETTIQQVVSKRPANQKNYDAAGNLVYSDGLTIPSRYLSALSLEDNIPSQKPK